jgi:hypothetical protein
MATGFPISPTEILDDVIQPIEPAFMPEFARLMLSLHLSEPAQDQIRQLLISKNAGTLDASEQKLLDNYLLVGQFLDLLQAKARVALRDQSPSS